jgi:hypothetical protein
LDDQDIAAIVAILDGWSGVLTWNGLIDVVDRRLFARYTRQALHRHERVRQAFSMRKAAMADGSRGDDAGAPSFSPELDAAMMRISRLEKENARLANENDRLLEQFIRWAYNAHTRGLDQHFLNRSLPRVDRDLTPIQLNNPRQ